MKTALCIAIFVVVSLILSRGAVDQTGVENQTDDVYRTIDTEVDCASFDGETTCAKIRLYSDGRDFSNNRLVVFTFEPGRKHQTVTLDSMRDARHISGLDVLASKHGTYVHWVRHSKPESAHVSSDTSAIFMTRMRTEAEGDELWSPPQVILRDDSLASSNSSRSRLGSHLYQLYTIGDEIDAESTILYTTHLPTGRTTRHRMTLPASFYRKIATNADSLFILYVGVTPSEGLALNEKDQYSNSVYVTSRHVDEETWTRGRHLFTSEMPFVHHVTPYVNDGRLYAWFYESESFRSGPMRILDVARKKSTVIGRSENSLGVELLSSRNARGPVIVEMSGRETRAWHYQDSLVTVFHESHPPTSPQLMISPSYYVYDGQPRLTFINFSPADTTTTTRTIDIPASVVAVGKTSDP